MDEKKLSGDSYHKTSYFMSRWKKMVEHEGLETYLKVRILSAIVIAIALGIFGFGAGRVSISRNVPIVKYVPQFSPQPTINPWQESIFYGTLRVSNENLFSLTSESESVTLNAPANLNLKDYIGRRIMAKGFYNKDRGIMIIPNEEGLEILPTKSQKIPTIIPIISPTIQPEEYSPNPIYNNPSM